jgi:carboxypeptidase D
VQSALGVPLNFTALSNAVYAAVIGGTGDVARANKSHTEFLLSRGKRVVMVYGDRDYRCNWLGAENISLSLDFPGQDKFAASGYAELITNATYIGGITRQAGDLSFNRVFESGHYAAGSQPETTYRIFERSMRNLDTATGKVKVDKGCGYQTKGPLDSWSWRNVLPAAPPIVCTTWDVLDTCTPNQASALADGTAIIQNDFVVSPAS